MTGELRGSGPSDDAVSDKNYIEFSIPAKPIMLQKPTRAYRSAPPESPTSAVSVFL
jgi:hypothetical protein